MGHLLEFQIVNLRTEFISSSLLYCTSRVCSQATNRHFTSVSEFGEHIPPWFPSPNFCAPGYSKEVVFS